MIKWILIIGILCSAIYYFLEELVMTAQIFALTGSDEDPIKSTVKDLGSEWGEILLIILGTFIFVYLLYFIFKYFSFLIEWIRDKLNI